MVKPIVRALAACSALALAGAERSLGDAVQLLQSDVLRDSDLEDDSFPLFGKKKQAKQATTPAPVKLEKLTTRQEEQENAVIIDKIEKLSGEARAALQGAVRSGSVQEANKVVEQVRPLVKEVDRLWSSLKGSEAKMKASMHIEDFELERVMDAIPSIAKDEQRFKPDRDSIGFSKLLHRVRATQQAVDKAERDGLPPAEIAKYRQDLKGMEAEQAAREYEERLAPYRNAVQQAKALRRPLSMKAAIEQLQIAGASAAEIQALRKDLLAVEEQNAKETMVRQIAEGQRLGPFRKAIQDAQGGTDLKAYASAIDKAEKAGLPVKEVKALRANLEARKFEEKKAGFWAPYRSALREAKSGKSVTAMRKAVEKAEEAGLPREEMRRWKAFLRRWEDNTADDSASHFDKNRLSIAKAEKAGNLAQMEEAIRRAEKAGMSAEEVKAAWMRLKSRQEERESHHKIHSAEREGNVAKLARAIQHGKDVGVDPDVLDEAKDVASSLVKQKIAEKRQAVMQKHAA